MKKKSADLDELTKTRIKKATRNIGVKAHLPYSLPHAGQNKFQATLSFNEYYFIFICMI